MEEILTYRRYKEMIETCEKLQSPETVKAHITAYLKKYQNDNPMMAIAMMEIIESENPSIEHIDEEVVEEVSSFVDLENEIEQPQLRYLYTLLLNWDRNYSTSENLQRIAPASEISPVNTFKSTYSGDKLDSLRKWLVSEQYIAPIDSNHFIFLFSNQPAKKHKDLKLVWKLKTTSGSANAVLFGLITQVAKEEYNNRINNTSFLGKISALIVPEGAAEFRFGSLRKAFAQWQNRKAQSFRKRTVDEKYKLLLDFIDEL